MKARKLLSVISLLLATSIKALEPTEFFGGDDIEDYLQWFDDRGSSNYPFYTFLEAQASSNDGMAVHWSISDTHIVLAVAVRSTGGWLSFGLSENGSMQGSDVLIFETSSPDTVLDAHILDELLPLQDDCQDWELVSSLTEDKEFVVVEVRRLLDTKDLQDRPILLDESNELPVTRVIAAWGDSETVGYHGLNRARGGVQWSTTGPALEKLFASTMEQHSDGYFEIKAENHRIKGRDTEYADFCVTWKDLLAQGVPEEGASIVGFEPVIDKARFVHHFTVHGSTDPTENGCGQFQGSELAYVWAPGEPPLALPLQVGGPLGPGSFQSFNLETHYDNKDLVQGVLDSSGVRFYYSTTKRPIEAGILQLGDPFVRKNGQKIGAGKTEYSFRCPETCSKTLLDEPVTVMREYLHMHAVGASARNELIRDGKVIHVGAIDFFNFDQQGNQAVVQQPFQVRPGDAFRTVCNYDSDEDESIEFGLSSQEEMCIAFLMYFPRKTFDNFWWGRQPWLCGSELGVAVCETTDTSQTIDALPRSFGTPPSEECLGSSAEEPSGAPSLSPTFLPSQNPSIYLSTAPVATRSQLPSISPLHSPSSLSPVTTSSVSPSGAPADLPSSPPTGKPSLAPTPVASSSPAAPVGVTNAPASPVPTGSPTSVRFSTPSMLPSSGNNTTNATELSDTFPSVEPTMTTSPSLDPTKAPGFETVEPSLSFSVTGIPSLQPTRDPTKNPTTSSPSTATDEPSPIDITSGGPHLQVLGHLSVAALVMVAGYVRLI